MEEAVQRAIPQNKDYTAEYRVVPPEGGVRWSWPEGVWLAHRIAPPWG